MEDYTCFKMHIPQFRAPENLHQLIHTAMNLLSGSSGAHFCFLEYERNETETSASLEISSIRGSEVEVIANEKILVSSCALNPLILPCKNGSNL